MYIFFWVNEKENTQFIKMFIKFNYLSNNIIYNVAIFDFFFHSLI